MFPPVFRLGEHVLTQKEHAQPIIVMGGGPAGMMAAGRAAELGASVLLLERRNRLGNKLRISGKGRCNLTNDRPIRELLPHLGSTGQALRNALARFGPRDTIAFFEGLGVPCKTERGARVFPASDSAQDVAEAMVRYCRDHGVRFGYDTRVQAIRRDEEGVCAVDALDRSIATRHAILATGGASYPRTGSTGDGYAMARALGHTVTPIRPGLVPLTVAEPYCSELQGLSLRNVSASLVRGDKTIATEFGEMLFTHFGVSGPIILTLSSRAGEALAAGPLKLCIDLKPALDEPKLDQRLLRDIDAHGKASYERLLAGLLPRSMVPVMGRLSGIPSEQRLATLSGAQRATLRGLLKGFELTVTGTRPIDEAIVTLGGVSTRELAPQTMASRLVPGLYLAGEIIDLAGDTGGYNLQIAFTTGRVAGEAAARSWLDADERQGQR